MSLIEKYKTLQLKMEKLLNAREKVIIKCHKEQNSKSSLHEIIKSKTQWHNVRLTNLQRSIDITYKNIIVWIAMH